MDKFLLSTPGLIITGNGCLAILWIIGKLSVLPSSSLRSLS